MSDGVFRDGTSQSERSPAAAQPDYFRLDEMRFEQRLAMGVDYARLLRFFELNDTPEANPGHEAGAWAELFLGDDAPVLAQILTFDLAASEADFRRFLRDFRRRAYALPQGFEPADLPTYRLARKLDEWFDRLRPMDGGASAVLSQQLAGLIIPGLMYELGILTAYLHRFDTGIGARFRREFRPFWFAAPARGRSEPGGAIPERGGAEAEQFLRRNFHAFYKAVAILKNAAATTLNKSLASQTHSPAVGLFMTFLRLYQKVQGSMNRFTERHRDFYYHDVLKLQHRPAVSDTAYLLLRQDGGSRRIHVPKGTGFMAGRDEHKRDIVFDSDDDVSVGQAQVGALYTLHFERNTLISPERYFGLATAARAERIRLPEEALAGDTLRPWPLLGACKPGTESELGVDAPLGFALSSPVLLLGEGYRDINIAFDFEPAGQDGVQTAEGPPQMAQWLGRLAEATGTTELDAFFKCFRDMFRISLTTESGWYDVAEYLPLSNALKGERGSHGLVIQICLPPEADPIARYSVATHGGGYATDFPIIRFTLNPASYLYPYSLLAELAVCQIEIDVNVRGVRSLLVYNHLGQLDANTPFSPFGPTPTLGSYFLVGAAETAQKRLTDFEVELEWGALPSRSGGFERHYAGYGGSYENDEFQVSVSALKAGKWLPGDLADQPRDKLFATLEGGAVCTRRVLSCRSVVALTQPSDRLLTGAGLSYSAQTKDGFFRFKLSAPNQAFGHQDYPLLLTRVLTENARLKKVRLQRPIPQPPYTPLVTSIALNYGARATWHLDVVNLGGDTRAQEKMFHVHPFGTEPVSARTHRRISLLPAYDEPGNLFIGLTGEDPSGLLTLLFHLREDSTPGNDVRPSEPIWSYLSSRGWKRLEKHRVRADGTRGFLSSGIVELDLPPDFGAGGGAMPAGLSWLRVSMARHPETVCSALGVYAHAVQVRRRPDAAVPAYPAQPVPAGTIKAAQTSIPGIVQIVQPVSSGGGRSAESLHAFRTRVGERLRHKRRASLPWDYERLILEHFPGIFKVKCFPHLTTAQDPARRIQPGNLMIVVVPALPSDAAGHVQPLADRLLLRDIREFVQALASPFARVEVRNPTYELIQVRCTVACDDERSGNHINALDKAISDYLSPWQPVGNQTCFGWRVRGLDLESYIQNLPYIEYLTAFSMLRVASEGDDRYRLDDTVRASGERIHEFAPLRPWSIAVPFQRHHIDTTNQLTPSPSQRTGLGELEIGATLIIP